MLQETCLRWASSNNELGSHVAPGRCCPFAHTMQGKAALDRHGGGKEVNGSDLPA